MSPRQIAELVPMPELLREFGTEGNERTGRARCPIHGGPNPTAFKWTQDGRWYCYRCGVGGDRIDLVRRVRGCGFREAVDFLAALAGVTTSPASQEEIQRLKTERQRLDTAASWLETAEREDRLSARMAIHLLEWLERYASDKLAALTRDCEPPPAEVESAWDDLALPHKELRWWVAAYYLAAFGSQRSRLRFMLHPEQQLEIVEEVLLAGGVTCEDGSFFEVPL